MWDDNHNNNNNDDGDDDDTNSSGNGNENGYEMKDMGKQQEYEGQGDREEQEGAVGGGGGGGGTGGVDQQQIDESIRQQINDYRHSIASSASSSSSSGQPSPAGSMSSVHIDMPPPPMPGTPDSSHTSRSSGSPDDCRICLDSPSLPPFLVCDCRVSMCADCLRDYILARQRDGQPAATSEMCEICRQPYRNVRIERLAATEPSGGQISVRQFLNDQYQSVRYGGRPTIGGRLSQLTVTLILFGIISAMISRTSNLWYVPMINWLLMWTAIFINQLIRAYRRRRQRIAGQRSTINLHIQDNAGDDDDDDGQGGQVGDSGGRSSGSHNV